MNVFNENDRDPSGLPSDDLSALIRRIRALTPARVLSGRVGYSYLTETQLALREDHAAALDAVHAEIDLARDLGPAFLAAWRIFEVRTRAATKPEFLLRPDLGRLFRLEDETAVAEGPHGIDLQIAIGDGLSATAVVAQVPELLPFLVEGAKRLGLTLGRPFFIRNCRVGVLNEIGRLLQPVVAVLLIGERPGLSTSESLSAYLAYRPEPGHTDAQRNLISNIHAAGTLPREAADRILRLATEMIRRGAGGVAIKEEFPEVLRQVLP